MCTREWRMIGAAIFGRRLCSRILAIKSFYPPSFCQNRPMDWQNPVGQIYAGKTATKDRRSGLRHSPVREFLCQK